MSVLDLQRKGQQIGRIRIGQQVSFVKDGKEKTRPARLDTFRFTTASRHTADAIADLFGGEVREWGRQWEVITKRSEISVMVPPRDAVVSQWYEMWNAGGCIRRCDSQHEQISNGPCQCPHAANPDDAEEADKAARERAELAKTNPPRACHLITRVSVMIPDLPGLGVFRLDTGSFYAASEIGDTAALMQAARDKGVFIPATLRIEQRERVAGGQTKKYPVPVLEILATFRQIASGQLEAGGMAAQLPPAPGAARAAIAASPASPQAAGAPALQAVSSRCPGDPAVAARPGRGVNPPTPTPSAARLRRSRRRRHAGGHTEDRGSGEDSRGRGPDGVHRRRAGPVRDAPRAPDEPAERTPARRRGAGVMAEPLTPMDIEAKLRSLVTDLTRAQQSLAQARDIEVEKRHELNRARRKAILSEKSPKVTRGGYTTAERDAWVDGEVADLQFTYDKAVVIRESAQDHLRVLRDQAEIVRSLGASVRQAFEMAGVGS